MKNFKVELFDGMDRLIESIETSAKGKKSVIKKVKFKNQIGSDYYIIATITALDELKKSE